MRSELTRWMSSYASPSSSELVVEPEVERDRDAVARRDRPALAPAALDEHLVRLELVPGDPEAAVGQLLELARLRAPRARLRAPCRASARAPAGSASRAARPPRPVRARPPSRAARRRSPRRCPSRCAPSTTSRRSGCRSLIPDVERACRPSSTTRRTSAISSSSARSGSATSGQPARCTDSGPSRTSVRQRWSVTNGRIGASTRSVCTSAYQSVRERGLVAVPEAPPRAADVPVREIVEVRLEVAHHVRRRASARTPPVASATKACVRSTSQRSSGSQRPPGSTARPTPAGSRRCSRSRRRT